MDPQRYTLSSEGPLGNGYQTHIPAPTSGLKKGNGRLGPARVSTIGSLHHPYHNNQSVQQPIRSSIASGGGAYGGGPNSQETNSMNGSTLQTSRRSTLASRPDPRQSTLGVGGGMSGGMGGDGGGFGIGRTPQTARAMPGSTRRSSVYTSTSRGRPSMAYPSSSSSLSTIKDPRPIRDKQFQLSCSRNLQEYLIQARYSIPFGPKTFTSPTSKEFQSIFKFLIDNLIDQNFNWNKKFEDDALLLLKDLKYPGLDSISKTSFTAPGSPTSWQGLLAMLNWLVEICKAHENWNDGHVISDPFLMSPHDLPLDHPHLEDRLLWDFSSRTYDQWFDGGAEEFPEAENDLEQMYERMAATAIDENQKLETALAKRTTELQQLHAQEPPLRKLEDEYLQLMGDKTKFIAFIDLHKQKAEKTKQAILKIREAISGQDQDLANQRNELSQIESAVAVQNLTPDEVNRMNHERESLNRGLDDLRTKTAEASQSAYDQEMMVTKSMDRFENLLADYTSLSHQIGLLNQPADIDFKIEIDLGIEDLEELKNSGNQMRNKIWKGLQNLRENYRQELLNFENNKISLEDNHDRLEQKVERQKEAVTTSEFTLKLTVEQAEAAQSKLTSENANTIKIINNLEQEISSMMAATQQGVLVTQSQLESTRIAFTELRHKTAILQDSLLAQVGSHIDTIMKAKEHAANSLRSIKAFAETQ